MKKTLLLVVAICTQLTLYAQYNPHWVVPAIDYSKTGSMLATDSGNNAVIVGQRPSYLGGQDIFIRKFDVNGNLLWEIIEPSGAPSKYQHASWVNIDATNNIYVTGYKYAGTSNVISDSIFAIKFDPSGNKIWKTVLPDYHLGELPIRSEIDSAGHLYLATILVNGAPGFSLIKFDTNGSVLFSVSDSSTSNISLNSMRLKNDRVVLTSYASLGSIACVSVFDTAGTFIWGNNYPTWGAMDLEIDSANNIYFISRKENQISATSGFDIKLVRLDPNGIITGEYNFDFGNSTDFASRMTLINGKISLIGWIVQAGSGLMNWVTIQTDLNGNKLWHAIYNQTNSNDEIPYWVSAKANGEVFVSGKGGPDTVSFNGSVYLRYVTVKYNNGNIQWVDADPYQGYTGIVNSIAPDGSLFVLGEYAMTAIHYLDNTTTLIPDINNQSLISCSPNPTSGKVSLTLTENFNASGNIALYDTFGRLVLEIPIEAVLNSREIKIDISHLPNGIYICKIPDNEKMTTVKIIKN